MLESDLTARTSGARPHWLALAVSALICAAAILAPGPDRTLRSAVALHDFGHVLGFGLVTALLASALTTRAPPTPRGRIGAVCTAALLSVLAGAAVEAIQGAIGGNADAWDIWRDTGGAAAAALLLIGASRVATARASVAAGVVGAAIVVAFAAPSAVALQDEWRANAQFPVLANFERQSDLSRFNFHTETTGSIVDTSGTSLGAPFGLRLSLLPARYPGASLIYFPRDWRGMRALRFSVVNLESTALDIVVRIDDAEHNQRFEDRFNRTFALAAGLNEIEIPLDDVLRAPHGRKFDLARVAVLLLFAVDLTEPREIIVGPIALVP